MIVAASIDAVTLTRLRETHPEIDERRAADPRLDAALGALSLASPFLTRLVLSEAMALDVLANLHSRVPVDMDNAEALARWKRLELLRIAARDLLGIDRLEEVGEALSNLADDVLTAALRLAGAEGSLVVVGMGKLAGRELNYASDIDVMFAGEADERIAREAMAIARRSFRVDAALRPEGRDGPLVRSVESYKAYWEQWAKTWEFQALLKSRPIAGPQALRDSWREAADAALWSREFGADELRELRDMKARSEALVARKGLADREVKRGRGGIRDIEFAVQLLQLVHGDHDESIRSATTLVALQQLAEGGYIDAGDGATLADAYRYLRAVEHRLQLVEDEQTHTVPTDRASRERLARALGHVDSPQQSATEAFEHELRSHQAFVRSAHERLYFRPLLEAFAAGAVERGGRVEERLSAFGFTDANRTRQAVMELTKGLARSSRLMQRMMPLLLDWLSSSPDPDGGLFGLRTLIAGFRTPTRVVAVFRDSPEAARRLCLLLGTSKLFASGFSHHPELIDDLGDTAELAPLAPVRERLERALGWRADAAAQRSALLRLADAEKTRIAVADVLGLLADAEAGQRRAALADAVVQLALELLEPPVPIAAIAVGRFGGREMSYASDLDVILIHGGSGGADQASADRFAQQLRDFLDGAGPGHGLYGVDYDLRPEGKNGVLVRSLDGARDYYSRWAHTWERQALVRARLVAGDASVGAAFMEIVDPFVWEAPLDAVGLREIRHLKARMERERMPRGEDPRFNLKLGKGSLADVEWTVQLLQLQHGVRETNTLAALAALEKAGVVAGIDARVLEEAWRFADLTRNRWFLVHGGPNDALPVDPGALARLARSLDLAPVELRERYLQRTRRARAVMERLFYGKGP